MPDPLQDRLRDFVTDLCAAGPRYPGAASMRRAADAVTGALAELGLIPREHAYQTPDGPAWNVDADLPAGGGEGPILVVGAHYDSVPSTPGADDNASATAAMIEIGRLLLERPLRGRVRLVGFACEEPPYYHGPHMGSLVYARACKAAGEQVEMICLESLGYYSSASGSQQNPLRGTPLGHLLPDTGNFLAFEADEASADLLGRFLPPYEAAAQANPLVPPAVGRALPRELTTGMSDHWAFWQCGYPALMVTDTAVFRNPNYHRPSDTPDTLDYPRLAAATRALADAARNAAGGGA